MEIIKKNGSKTNAAVFNRNKFHIISTKNLLKQSTGVTLNMLIYLRYIWN